MNNYDYVVLIDENGQPYIAHSFKSSASSAFRRVKSGVKSAGKGMGRGWRATTKYLLKIGKGAKAKYAYTPEEVDRLLGRGKRAVQNFGEAAKKAGEATKRAAIRAADKLGVDELIRFSKARESGIGVGEAARDYSETPLGKAEIAFGKAKATVKKYGNMTLGALKDAAGTVREKAPGVLETVGSAAKSAGRALTNAEKREAYNEAVANYNKVQGTGGEDESAAYWAMVEAENALKGSGVRGAAKSVASAAKTAAGKVKGAADTASEKITTAKAKFDLDKATRAYEKAKGTSDARQAYWDMMAAQQEYERVTGKKAPRSGKY